MAGLPSLQPSGEVVSWLEIYREENLNYVYWEENLKEMYWVENLKEIYG